MKKLLWAVLILLVADRALAQETYTMGYEKATITVKDPSFFSILEFPGQEPVCGFYDKDAENFYSTEYHTFRYVEEDFVREVSQDCAREIDFDPKRYYGSLTLPGVIDSVEWDAMVIHFNANKVRLRIQVDEREIDALYKNFYDNYTPGKVHLILRLKTFDTPNEDYITYCKLTEVKPKPKRTMVKLLRW
ncbi:MAG: hypothetical protein JNM95_05500 [Chitinophagaceae bacterium]|nr:hypothetical protein [Chitinophagaceae bacterium]